MTPILPISTLEIVRLEELVSLAVVLPAQQAIEAVSGLRALIQLLQDYVWETAITSVEGVLVLGTFNLLVSFSLAMWVASAVRRGNLRKGVATLKTTIARALVFGRPQAAACAPVAFTQELA